MAMPWRQAVVACAVAALMVLQVDAQVGYDPSGSVTDSVTGLAVCPVADGTVSKGRLSQWVVTINLNSLLNTMQMQHVLRVLRAQASIQTDIMRKATLMSVSGN